MRLQQVRACASAPQGGPGGRQRAVLPAVPCADHRSQPAGCGMLRDLPARFSWPPPPTRALGGGRRGRGRWLGGGPLTVGEKDENAALLCSGTWKLWYSSGPYCGQSRGQPDQPPALRADADSTRGAETKIKPRGHRELCGSPRLCRPRRPGAGRSGRRTQCPLPPRVQLAPGPHPWQHTHFPRGARRAGPWFS